MNLTDSYEDHMNRMATDILDCPRCESEDLALRGSEYDEKSHSETEYWLCNRCEHTFEHYT